MSQHNIIAKFMAYTISWIVTFRKVATCTNQPVGFSGYSSTHEYLTDLKNKLQQKAYSVAFGSSILVINENHSLPLCAYVVAFGKSDSQIQMLISTSITKVFIRESTCPLDKQFQSIICIKLC